MKRFLSITTLIYLTISFAPSYASVIEVCKQGSNTSTYWVNKFSSYGKYEKGKKEGKITETVPMGKMDRTKFMKYFDLVLKTAGSNKAEIYKILKRMMPSLDNRTLLYMAQGLEDAVKQMTGGGEE